MALAEYTTEPPATTFTHEAAATLLHLPVDLVIPAADNPRAKIGDVSGLAASIRAHGVLSAITVEGPDDDGRYPLIVGHRRLAASKMAGLPTIPAIVRGFAPMERLEAMISENDQRVGLSAMEQGRTYQRLLDLGADPADVAARIGRPQGEVEGRLAVLRLPKRVQRMLRDGAMEYAEATLLTEIAEHPEDIDAALDQCEKWGWELASSVRRVQENRMRVERAAVSRAKLERLKVRVIDQPETGMYDRNARVRPLGRGYGHIEVSARIHRRESCHAAYVSRDGNAVEVCTEPNRHSDHPEGAAIQAVDVKMQRSAKRAANRARRDAAANRVEVIAALLGDKGGLSREMALDYLLGAVLDHAPREITPAAARLIGLDVPDGQMWQASIPAEKALREYASLDHDHLLRAATAIHLALSEKDAAAEFPAHRGGDGVVAYLDLLVAHGREELAGDTASRAAYAPDPEAAPLE